MNTRTASDNRSKPSAGSTASDVDKQLAFIDNVCSLLIESRFGHEFSYAPFSEFTPAAEDERSSEQKWMPLHEFTRPSLLDLDPILDKSFTPPEPARPTALANRRSSPAASYSSMGVRMVLGRFRAIFGTHFAKLLSAIIQPRGSPAS
jgi:hypothetical protein